jgi:hypothetical protein
MKMRWIFLFVLAFQMTANGQVVINEICTSNGDLKYDPDFFDFPAYVELYNSGTSSASVGGFYLSDDSGIKGKWRIPSGTSIPGKGYLIIWCDERNSGLHTNFNLDSDGEEVFLSNASQTELDRITFPEQYINISFGRLSDGGSTIDYMVSPTPGAKNNPLTGTIRLENPTLSVKSGRYASAQSLSMTAAEDGAEVRFTTDGSEPNSGSELFANAVPITKTTTVKAKTFKAGFLPSKTEVKTYFISEHAFTLPVVSLSTKPAYLFDNTIGIVADGTNGIPGNCMDQPRNWNQDWDRHAVFEYFEKTGEKILDQNVDIRVSGGCSRNNPQKSLVLRARDKFGSKTIEHEFFKSKQINNFGGIVLRNGGNDFYYTMFRDGLMQSLTIGQMDVDYLAYQPATVYLNGTYWGIQNIREKVDGDYIEANYGVGKEDVDIIETFGNAIEGTSTHYAVYLDSLQRIPRATPEAFTFINRYIDVQEFINYLTAEIYYANTDWPGNNIKFWRQRSTNGKFRWILWDLDFGMGAYQWASYPTHPTLEFATDPDNDGWPNPAWSTLHLRLLLEIPEFKNRFIQTLTTSLSTTFKADRVNAMITSFQNTISAEMPYHVQRWNLSMDNWNYEVSRLKLFAGERNEYMKNHIASFFGLGDGVRISVNTFPSQSGTVALNGISSASVENAFYFRNLPFNISAQASPGYTFSHYKIRKREAVTLNLVSRGAVWKYNDSGVQPTSEWKNEIFADGSWNEGAAELGYGDADEATTVGFGGNTADKFITTYFRKSFNVTDTVGFSSLTGSVLFDDGVVVYLNGEEVFRNNMPAGTVDNTTLAIANQVAETTFYGFTIPKGKIKPGTNVLAVEVHQNSNASSDISFNLDLSAVQSGNETEYITEELMVEDVANSDVVIEAHFTSITPSSGLVINEFSANNEKLEDSFGERNDWIEIYNNGSAPVDIGNYFITDDLGVKLKHRILPGKNGETLIAPGAYKILWADDDIEQGPLHLGFKLSDKGEEIGLYQMVGALIEKADEVIFETQLPLTSFSRIPNATGPFTLTAAITPMAENIFEIPTAVEEEMTPITLYPNPANSTFRISSEAASLMSVEIYNSTGVKLIDLDRVYDNEEISLSENPAGIYLVKIRLVNRTIVKRLMKM